MNHPSHLGSIWQSKDLIESFESKALDSLPLAAGSSDHALDPFDCNRMLDLFHHGTFRFVRNSQHYSIPHLRSIFSIMEPFGSPVVSQVFFQKPPQGFSVGG